MFTSVYIAAQIFVFLYTVLILLLRSLTTFEIVLLHGSVNVAMNVAYPTRLKYRHLQTHYRGMWVGTYKRF